MKKITAYECDHCGRYLKTKKSIINHEAICFKNTTTKSCITCKNLCIKMCVDGVAISENEELILMNKVPDTYDIISGNDMECDYPFLKEEYQYLYNAEAESYCGSIKCVLKKLRTNCNKHQLK